MRDATFFTLPAPGWQRSYEALRTPLVKRVPDHVVADRFVLASAMFAFFASGFVTAYRPDRLNDEARQGLVFRAPHPTSPAVA